MIPRLNKIHALMSDDIDQAMFLRDSAGPNARAEKLDRFRLADSLKGVQHDRFNQLKNAQRRLPIRLHPISQILPELRLKYGFPFDDGARLLQNGGLLQTDLFSKIADILRDDGFLANPFECG